MEALLKTYRNLIRDEWSATTSVNGTDVPAVLGRPIYGWYHGDREILPEEFPAIVFDPESENLNWSATHTQEREWQWDVLLFDRTDNFDYATFRINEMYRLFERAARIHSHFWVFERNYMTMDFFFDPQYLIDLNTNAGPFQGVLDPYLTEVQTRHDTWWDDAHKDYAGIAGSGPVAPTPRAADLHVAAYLRLFEVDPLTDPWASTSVTYGLEYSAGTQTSTPAEIIQYYRDNLRRPVRFIGDSRIRSASWGFVKKGTALLRGLQVSMFAKEQEGLSVFGPR